MNWISEIIGSPGFQQVVYICFGAAVTVALTYWCQKVLIREQYKWQKRLGEEQRDTEKMEKDSRDEEMQERIRRTFLKPQPFVGDSIDHGIGFGVTLKNETPWTVIIRDVMFDGPEGRVHISCTDTKVFGDRKALERLADDTVRMPPFSQGNWMNFSNDYRRAHLSFGLPYDNCTIKCEFTTVYGDTAVLDVSADPPLGEELTDFSESCRKHHLEKVEEQQARKTGKARDE